MSTANEIWADLENGLSRFESDSFSLADLNMPASNEDVDQFQLKFEVELPQPLIDSLLVHDGETVRGNSIFPWAFCSLKSMAQTIEMQFEIHGDGRRAELYLDSAPAGYVRRDVDWSKGWIPVMTSDGGELLCDLDPAINGSVGQVFKCPSTPCGYEREVVAGDYLSLLAKLAEIANNPKTTLGEYGTIELSTLDFEFSS